MQAQRRRCREPVRPLSFRGGVLKPALEVSLSVCGGRARVRRSARFPSIEAGRIARPVLHGIFFFLLAGFPDSRSGGAQVARHVPCITARRSSVVRLGLQSLQSLDHDQQRAAVLVRSVPRVDDRVAQQVVVLAARWLGIDAVEIA